ncbi:hypothetical protein BH20ACT1_BH20ACT1_10730 [soil metagenome]
MAPVPATDRARPPASVSAADEPRSGVSTARRIAESFRPYRREVVGIVVLVLLGAGVGVVNPLLIKVLPQG